MAKETSAHHCSFLAKHRENCKVLACLRQSRGQLAHPKARLAYEPRHFLLRSHQALLHQDFMVFQKKQPMSNKIDMRLHTYPSSYCLTLSM